MDFNFLLYLNERPFQLFVENKNFFQKTGKKNCLNGRTSLKVNLDYVNDFMSEYKLSGFFGLMFMADYSHDTSDHLNQIDKDLSEFLIQFYENKPLSSSTVLILFSDHGPRFNEIRKSMKGLVFVFII